MGSSGIFPSPTQRRLHPSPSGPAWAAGGDRDAPWVRQVFFLPPHSGGYTRVPPVQPGPRGGIGTPRGFVRYFSFPHTAAVIPESLRSSPGRGGIGTPRGFVRYFTFPHTAAVTPESLRSSLGRGGIGTPRGFVRYFTFPHTAAVTPESLRSSLGRGGG